jgi:hypothetical protein
VAALVLAGASLGLVGPALAQTVTFDCTQPANSGSGALESFIENNVGAGDTVDIKGTCIGDVTTKPDITLQGDNSVAGTINGHVFILSEPTTVTNLTIDGTGVADSGGGVSATGNFASATVTNSTIQNFSYADVGVYQGAVVYLNNDTLQNSAGTDLNVGQATVNVSGGTIEGSGNGNPGVGLFQGANAQFTTTVIENNAGPGIALQEGATVHLGSQGPVDPSQAVAITGNQQGGIIAEDASQVFINQADIENNTGGPALALHHSSGNLNAGTVSSPAGLALPTIQTLHGELIMNGPSLTVTGSGSSNAIYAIGNSTMTLIGATVTDDDANDATILVDDGSALVSAGGNTISNTGTSGIAIEVSNESTFHQHIATQFGQAAAADTITGAGSDQIESNFELGTGASTPSNWTGAITVAQSSTVRMDGGITVTGTVTITQASNGYFNTSIGGQNIVTGGVSCPFTATPGARIAGPSKVLLSPGGASAVTIGNTSPDCQQF